MRPLGLGRRSAGKIAKLHLCSRKEAKEMKELRLTWFLALIVVVNVILVRSAIASWIENGTPICTQIGQQYPTAMAPDGEGGAIIVWNDSRAGNPDLYAQRIDAYGNSLWTIDGVAVCTDSADQGGAVVVSDSQGGAIIAWADERGGTYSDIYAQRVDAEGIPVWVT